MIAEFGKDIKQYGVSSDLEKTWTNQKPFPLRKLISTHMMKNIDSAFNVNNLTIFSKSINVPTGPKLM